MSSSPPGSMPSQISRHSGRPGTARGRGWAPTPCRRAPPPGSPSPWPRSACPSARNARTARGRPRRGGGQAALATRSSTIVWAPGLNCSLICVSLDRFGRLLRARPYGIGLTSSRDEVMDWEMTASETVEQRTEAAASVSQRRLTIGICINVVAIAFEVVAVAGHAGGRPRPERPDLLRVGVLFRDRHAVRHRRRGPAERPAGPGPTLVIGMVIFVAGLLLAGSAHHMLQLVGGRLVQGWAAA